MLAYRFGRAWTLTLAIFCASASLGATAKGSLTYGTADDLDVLWIERRPAIEFVWNSSAPDVEGWPAAGEPVEWVAHVENTAARPIAAFVRWTVDGRAVSADRVMLPAGRSELSLVRIWTSARQTLAIRVDTRDEVAEASETNNELSVATDALSIGFWVEQSFAAAFANNAVLRSVGLQSVEDWLQAQTLSWNAMAALAIYPETPDGVLDRFRIDRVDIVPDGALPLAPPPGGINGTDDFLSLHFPDSSNRTVDLQWGFPASAKSWYGGDGLHGYFDHSLFHELGHARYLVDVYQWDVGSRRGDEIALSPQPPSDDSGYVHRTAVRGLMNQQYGFIDRYSAAALNQIAHHRATAGNYNAPANLGVFLDESPERNFVRLRWRDGTPVANRAVRVYTSDFARRFDAVADAELATDANGEIEVGRHPFGVSPLRDPKVVIFAVDRDGETFYGFLESLWFQLAWWRGERQRATYEVPVGPEPPCTINTPLLHRPFDVASSVTQLSWTAVRGAKRYLVHASIDGGPPEVVATSTSAAAAVEVRGLTAWWVEAEIDGCDNARSGLGIIVPQPETRRRAVRR